MKAAKCLRCHHMVSNNFNLFISEADLKEPVKLLHQYDCHCQPNSVNCGAKLPLVAFLRELYAVTVGGFHPQKLPLCMSQFIFSNMREAVAEATLGPHHKAASF